MQEILIAVLSSGFLSTALTLLVTHWKGRRRQEGGIHGGVQQLLYDRIKYLCKSHLERGYISVADLEDLERMHKIYHDALKGNGFLDGLMERVRRLPTEVLVV